MKLTVGLLRSLEIGNAVLITETRNGRVDGQGDVTYLFGRLKPMHFITKRLWLVDTENGTVVKVIRITRIK